MGRRPKAATVHMRQGTYRPCLHGVQPVPAEPLVKPPGLGKYGSQLWDDIETQLIQNGAAGGDVHALIGMCLWYDEFRQAMNKVAKVAMTDQAYDDFQRLASGAWKRFLDVAGRFGLTPADRCRLKQQPEAQPSVLDDMLARRVS